MKRQNDKFSNGVREKESKVSGKMRPKDGAKDNTILVEKGKVPSGPLTSKK